METFRVMVTLDKDVDVRPHFGSLSHLLYFIIVFNLKEKIVRIFFLVFSWKIIETSWENGN